MCPENCLHASLMAMILLYPHFLLIQSSSYGKSLCSQWSTRYLQTFCTKGDLFDPRSNTTEKRFSEFHRTLALFQTMSRLENENHLFLTDHVTKCWVLTVLITCDQAAQAVASSEVIRPCRTVCVSMRLSPFSGLDMRLIAGEPWTAQREGG